MSIGSHKRAASIELQVIVWILDEEVLGEPEANHNSQQDGLSERLKPAVQAQTCLKEYGLTGTECHQATSFIGC